MKTRKMGHRTIKYIIGLFVCVAVLMQWTNAAQAKDGYKTVKVGYYQTEKFQEGDGKASLRSGYGYEYLQKIATYTGWKYEYVAGDWNELYQKLERGEIDLMAGISFEESRAGKVLYSDYEMLKETFYIYKDNDDTSIKSGDISTYSGKKIGVVDEKKMTDCIKQWADETGADITVIKYKNLEACAQAFNAHEIDGFVSADNIVSGYAGISPVEMIGKVPYYVCVANDRNDLLDELNTALSLINGQDMVYLAQLKNKYSADTSISIFLSKQEKEWMESHPKITVGYLNDYLPYSTEASNGQADGLLKDVLTDIFANLPGQYKPEISYISYQNQEDMIEALRNDEADIIFPVGGELPYAEQNEYQQSSIVIQAATDLVYKGEYSEDKIKKIAVNENNILQYEFTKINYPDAQLVICGSVEECIRAVETGKANSTVIEALRAAKLIGQDSGMEKIPLSNTCDICFGVNYGNSDLLRVLNHGLSMLGDGYALSHAYEYLGDIVTYGIDDFIRENMWLVYVLVAFLFICALCILWVRYKTVRRLSEAETNYNHILQDALMKVHQADHAKQVFLNNMSHDIRTPLNAILGLIEINQKSKDSQRIRENRQKVREAVNQLLTMMDHVIEMSKLESGGILDVTERVNLRQLTQEIEDEMNRRAEEVNVEFVRNTAEASQPWQDIYSNSIYIKEVLQHILENAIKYNHAGGRVYWEDEVKQLSEDTLQYSCNVSDTGIGMKAEFLEHVFEPFAQERYDARTTYNGSGLGMAIAKRLVEQMNGSIDIQSAEGEGTTVCITIPFKVCEEELPEAEAVPEVQETSDLSGFHILLAEDNELNIEIAQFILEDAGASVTVAKDGEQAVKAYTNAPSWTFDVILMDIMMPIMNGYEATKAIRTSQRADAKVIPVIATTACVSEEARTESEAAGIDAFVEKPLDMNKLMQILVKLVKK